MASALLVHLTLGEVKGEESVLLGLLCVTGSLKNVIARQDALSICWGEL